MGCGNKPSVILLVEDDPGDQELTRRALQDGEIAHELYVVEDGEAALDYLFGRGRYANPSDCPVPDLILLDLNLPKVTGKQVLEQIHNDAKLRHIPVVVLTTSQLERDIQQCYDSGASSYIVKPVGIDDFLRMIRCVNEYWFEIVRLSPVEGRSCPAPV
jgi:two-component system response regulator